MVQFRNLDGSLPHNASTVFKWAVVDRLMGRRYRVDTPFTTPRVDNDGSVLRNNTCRPSICWVGHASFLVQLAGVNLLVDPIWSKRIGGVIPRNVEPGVRLQDLPRVDAVLVTHNHRDHMDAPTLRNLSQVRHGVVPVGMGPSMRRLGFDNVVELQWWQSTELGPVSITLVPSHHWSRRGLGDTNTSLWGGFVIQGDGKRIFHSGDSAYFKGFREISERLGSPDVALLPIGAYEPEWFMRRQHMNPEDALRAGLDMDARRIVSMHWGTFQLSDEWLGEPPQRLLQLAARDPRIMDRVMVMPVGGVSEW